jgi:hypothetical protein
MENQPMKRSLTLIAVMLFGVLQAVSLSAGDLSQLAAAAGVTEAEAAGMSLAEIHARKINRESRGNDKVTVSSREHQVFQADRNRQLVAVAGLTLGEARGMSLDDIAASKANVNAGNEDRIPVAPARAARFDAAANPQLVAAAGLTIEEADGMTLAEVYRLKVNREARGDDRQGEE